MSNALVAIVVVSYNSSPFLPDLLESIKLSSYKNIKLIIVDNNSSDNSSNLINSYFPQATLIINNQNVGFSKANNQGIKEALNNSANYIFLLNHDTILDKDCIANLLKKSDNNTILQPLILIHNNNAKTELINTSGTYLNFLGFSYCNNYQKTFSKDFTLKTDILAASGAGMFIPATIIKHIGSLDENYFMYYEDLDFCWRAKISGFNVKLVKEAILWHKYKFKSSSQKWLYSEFSRLYFFHKNFQITTISKVLPIYLINELLSIIYSIYGHFFIQKINAYFKIFKIFPQIISQRFLQKKLRIVNDSELKSYISGHLAFSEVKIPFINIYNKIINFYYLNIYLKI